jgi:hypothetical protein
MTKGKKNFIESFESMLDKKGSLTDNELLSAIRLMLEASDAVITVSHHEEILIIKNKNVIFTGNEITPEDLLSKW